MNRAWTYLDKEDFKLLKWLAAQRGDTQAQTLKDLVREECGRRGVTRQDIDALMPDEPEKAPD